MNETVQPYALALVGVALLALLVLVQNFHSAYVNLLKRESPGGMPVEGSYEDRHWRLYRVHQNSVENFSAFAAAVIVGVLVGVSVFWITILAWIHVIARVVHWVIYINGIGSFAAGPRTMVFQAGFFSNVFIILLAVFAGLF